MPHVAILCEYSTLSGGERSMLATLPHLRSSGFDLCVFSPPGPLADAVAALGFDHEPMKLASGSTRLPLDDAREIVRTAIRRRPVDLIHANSLAMGRIVGPVARDLKLPSIAHLRDIVGLSAAAIDDLNLNQRSLAVSDAVRRFHTAQGLDAARTHVLHNGVDLNKFRPRPPSKYLHRELGLADDALLIAAIGQIALRKGLEMFVRACERLAPKFPLAHFLIVGSRFSTKEESVALERDLLKAADGVLAGRLHILGERRDIDRLLNELTLLVHLAHQEPLGRVLIEAAAAGVPVVATDVGGTAEIFPADAQAARLIAESDVESAVKVISELLSDFESQRRLAIAARRRAEAAFDIREASAGLTRHYEQVLAESFR
jgi:glycosyltransferase involved in cell wall biosynthesis